ncbi:hypothetical protein ACFCW4_31215 [Streptomyces virginiae]|uniref:hypothetical protein n=1 Tax=Streptomyces virginiae TaxID=1961 RepID=UPI0035D65AE1
MERLRGLLRGDTAAAGGRSESSRGARLLFGVALHGAARFAEGLELTALEARLVGALGIVFSEEELGELGRVYREESATRASAFPDALARLPLSEGYSTQDLRRDMAGGIAEEIARQANVRVLDLDAVEGTPVPGSRSDEEFARGVVAHGFGATVVTASGRAAAVQGRAPIRARLTMSNFWCWRESNEWSDSDELFWAACSSADDGGERTMCTREYQDVDKGETHRFDANTVVFDGPVDKALIVHVECWEKDQGSEAEVRRLLATMTTELRYTAEELRDVPSPKWEEQAGLIGMLGMFADLVEALINARKDDFVDAHVWTFDRPALERLAGSEFKSVFYDTSHQEGAFDLYIKFDVTQPAAANSPAAVTHNGSRWTPPQPLVAGAKTLTAPALALHNGSLYCAIRTPSNQIHLSRHDGTRWLPFTRVADLTTRHAPALASYKGRLHLAYTGTYAQETNILSTANGTDWSPQSRLPGLPSNSAPALAVRDNALHCAWTSIMFSPLTWTTDGVTWASGNHTIPYVTTAHAPALATHQGKLYMAARDLFTGRIVVNTNTAAGWSNTPITRAGRTIDTPALGVAGNTLHCAVRGEDDRIWLSSLTGTNTTWSDFRPITETGQTFCAPAAASTPTGDLHLAYRSSDF